MADRFEINCATGETRYVPLTDAELAQRAADQAAAANVPPHVDPVVEIVQQVLAAPDFDTAKRNLAAYIAKRKGT